MKIESFINEVCVRVVSYIEADDKPLVNYVPPAVLKRDVDLELPQAGLGREKLLGDIDEYLRSCVKTGNLSHLTLRQCYLIQHIAYSQLNLLTLCSLYFPPTPSPSPSPLLSIIFLHELDKAGFMNPLWAGMR